MVALLFLLFFSALKAQKWSLLPDDDECNTLETEFTFKDDDFYITCSDCIGSDHDLPGIQLQVNSNACMQSQGCTLRYVHTLSTFPYSRQDEDRASKDPSVQALGEYYRCALGGVEWDQTIAQAFNKQIYVACTTNVNTCNNCTTNYNEDMEITVPWSKDSYCVIKEGEISIPEKKIVKSTEQFEYYFKDEEIYVCGMLTESYIYTDEDGKYTVQFLPSTFSGLPMEEFLIISTDDCHSETCVIPIDGIYPLNEYIVLNEGSQPEDKLLAKALDSFNESVKVCSARNARIVRYIPIGRTESLFVTRLGGYTPYKVEVYDDSNSVLSKYDVEIAWAENVRFFARVMVPIPDDDNEG